MNKQMILKLPKSQVFNYIFSTEDQTKEFFMEKKGKNFITEV